MVVSVPGGCVGQENLNKLKDRIIHRHVSYSLKSLQGVI